MKFILIFILFITIAPMSWSQTSPEKVVQQQLDAYNAKDIAAFMAVFSDDVVLYSLGKTEPIASGKVAVETLYKNLFAQSPNLFSTVVNRIVLGEKVIDYEHITGRNGSEEIVELVMVYVVREAKIVEAYSIR
jgi:hypothetical protein